MCRTVHIETMPVQAGCFVAEQVADRYDDPLALCNAKSTYRPLSVDAHNRPVVSTIWVAVDPRDIEFVV